MLKSLENEQLQNFKKHAIEAAVFILEDENAIA